MKPRMAPPVLHVLSLFAGLLMLIICGCKSQKNPILISVDSSLKKAFFYKPGTYWIYRDSKAAGWTAFM